MTGMTALIHGGSGSGKSAFAENLLLAEAPRASRLVYIATMFPCDAEARTRIARHRAARAGKGFETLELYTNLAAAEPDIPEGAAVLLECLGNLAANEIFAPGGAGAGARESILDGLQTLARRARRIIVVSNDIVSDGVEYPPETEAYKNILSELNRTIVADSAVVVETVCGIPLRHRFDEAWGARGS